ncbi:MAG: hypothetical protein AB8G16_02185 [Gammaproteobacteria bacterium]
MPDNDERDPKPDDNGGSNSPKVHGQGGDDPIPLKAVLVIAAASAAAAFGGAMAGVNAAMGGG